MFFDCVDISHDFHGPVVGRGARNEKVVFAHGAIFRDAFRGIGLFCPMGLVVR